jgi:hypothetical protein
VSNFAKFTLTLSLLTIFFIPNLGAEASSQCYRWKMVKGKKQYTYFNCKKSLKTPIKSANKVELETANYTGNHIDLMKQAGISESDFEAVNFIVERESSWNPNSINRSSGACGLCQFLPCSVEKAGADWNNPITALKKGNEYVTARYGNWNNAKNFWLKNNWY